MALDKKRLFAGIGVACAAGLALTQLPFAGSETHSAGTAADRPSKEADRPEVRFSALPSREPMGEPRGELFGPRSWAPIPVVAERPAPRVPPKPSAPPLPYRIAGQVVQEDGMRVVLVKGNRIFEVRQGETLDDGYRLDAIAPHSLTFSYVPLGTTQVLAVAGPGLDLPSLSSTVATAASAPEPRSTAPELADIDAPRGSARLRFAGPLDVHAGKPFDVALKITSELPVRALPIQVSYDATRLKPIAVRPGDLFPGGKFMYRINGNGSIFVGASGTGRAASEADLLVVTFEPIASGPAELKVSSMLVQGVSGRAIAHEAPQIFRAAIR